MDSSKLFLSLILILSSWVFVGFSQGGLLDALGGAGLGGLGASAASGSSASLPCVQKLLPCQPYLSNSANPPSSCCVPLKEMITDDTKCLCDIFNNVQLLKSFNVSQEDALKLPKACGANADLSACTKSSGTTAPTASPATPSAPVPPTGSSTSSNGSTSDGNSTDSSKSSACEISGFGGFGFFIALSMSFFISAL